MNATEMCVDNDIDSEQISMYFMHTFVYVKRSISYYKTFIHNSKEYRVKRDNSRKAQGLETHLESKTKHLKHIYYMVYAHTSSLRPELKFSKMVL